MNRSLGKLLYGLLFVVVLPAALLYWQRALDAALPEMPAIKSPACGILLMGLGAVALAMGWQAIVTHGQGLPMNAYPPSRLVTHGIYAIFPHPIYLGFTAIVAGYAVARGTAAGLWIVAPVVALGAASLVFGYERIDMQRRFGTSAWPTALRLAAATDARPSAAERLSAHLLVFLPWIVIYEAFIFWGPMPDAADGYFAFERTWPVLEWAQGLYTLTYPFVVVAPLFARRRIDLRNFMIMGLAATSVGFLCFFLIPLKATPRAFAASNAFGRMLLLERSFDGAAGAFPAFHVVWSFLAAWLYARTWRKAGLWYGFALLIAFSCIATGMHALIDVCGALAVFVLVRNGGRLWCKTLRLTEGLANSWRAWRIGPLRIINHGIYVGAGAGLGIWLAIRLAGASHVWHVVVVGLASLVGAGIWGQAVEGASKLSRPFGYYGGLVGGSLGLLLSIALGADGWRLAGAFAVAGPFVQAVGRLRCLVQGCCHGRACSPQSGIVVSAAHSRVICLAHLGNRPIYPTQLYSIIYNLIIGAMLARFWTLAVPIPFVVGGYLLLGGLGRFVEEAYRGEPQTPRWGGLAVYQWLAVASFLLGAALMAVPGPDCTPEAAVAPWRIGIALGFGIVVAFAMGVDFPESKKRFSRLA